MRERLDAGVCVVGAGAGGAVVAAELAEGGARVVVLEQGPRHDPDGFTARPPEMLARLYRDSCQTATVGAPPILLPLGRGLGGTTLVNSGTRLPTPPPVPRRACSNAGPTGPLSWLRRGPRPRRDSRPSRPSARTRARARGRRPRLSLERGTRFIVGGMWGRSQGRGLGRRALLALA